MRRVRKKGRKPFRRPVRRITSTPKTRKLPRLRAHGAVILVALAGLLLLATLLAEHVRL